MFAAALQCARQLQQVLFIAQHGAHVGDARGAGRQRAGLVEHHGVHIMGALQGFCVLDQNAVARRHTRSGHNRCWRREAQRAGAGDHQHRDGVDQCHFQRCTDQQPARQCEEGDNQHGRHKHLADFIHQFLDRCLACLCVFDQTNDARQHRFRTQRGSTNQQATFAIDCTAGDLVTRLFGHRETFTGNQRFVGVAAALEHFAVHWKAFTWLDQHRVAKPKLADRDVLLNAVNQPQGAVRAQCFQGANGAGGLAFGAAFQVLAQQHQGDDHRRCFKIQMRRSARCGMQPLIDAQAITRAGADGDQQVHVTCARAHCFPCGQIKPRAQNELHRCRQCELRPCGQHPVHAQRRQEHRRDQW
ncbi:Uncharacterized protein AC506_2199 [Pseudomonas syringae pv. maculicola str. M6]|nr:Uncharacterized protein AC506_2199 [Pseudomonas syringae pv. maculicola str. M6]